MELGPLGLTLGVAVLWMAAGAALQLWRHYRHTCPVCRGRCVGSICWRCARLLDISERHQADPIFNLAIVQARREQLTGPALRLLVRMALQHELGWRRRPSSPTPPKGSSNGKTDDR